LKRSIRHFARVWVHNLRTTGDTVNAGYQHDGAFRPVLDHQARTIERSMENSVFIDALNKLARFQDRFGILVKVFRRRHAGIGHHRIHPSVGLLGDLEQLFDVFRVGHVSMNIDGMTGAILLVQALGERLAQFVVDVGNDDSRCAFGESFANRCRSD
jgi:hypothetical protein